MGHSEVPGCADFEASADRAGRRLPDARTGRARPRPSSSDPWPRSRGRPSSCSTWPIRSKNRSTSSSSEADACHSAFLCKVLGMYSGQLESKHQGLGEKIAEACQEVYVTVREREMA